MKWVISLINCGFSTRQIAELDKFSQVSDMNDEHLVICLVQDREKLHALNKLIVLLDERRNTLAACIHAYE